VHRQYAQLRKFSGQAGFFDFIVQVSWQINAAKQAFSEAARLP
jgi:hypothetical protein